MKTILIGMKGIGITTFIKEKLITAISNTKSILIFDAFDEYKNYDAIGVCRVSSFGKLTLAERNELVQAQLSSEINRDKTIILDGFRSYLNPRKDSTGNLSYEWLNHLLHGKESILTTFSTERLIDSRLRAILAKYTCLTHLKMRQTDRILLKDTSQ